MLRAMTAPPLRTVGLLAAGLLALACHPPPSSTRPASPRVDVPQPDARAEDAPAWKVDDPELPTREVSLSLEEGTWMNVDVSPDGTAIVFDLLGDLYEMPIDGGPVRTLTSGMAWDMHPRYSPDGRYIAFTSDRGGGDNIWVIDRDGSHPRQITKESFRLVTSPAWSPDGRFIAARKHFTGTRSLGAGEIWLYHVAGGSGVQVTERSNDQLDLGEPAFSPDGRYLYVSYDATGGPTFRYNKDPHAGIYAIDRIDLVEQRREVLIRGPGGAVRPTPSRDGKRLAFVRRVGLKTVLFVLDLDTRRMRPVYDGLDRDMQETWAIHGVYPQMAWTADDRAVVLWAGGRILKVDVETGRATPIPFHVETKRKVAEAVRYPVKVHPATFTTRMLRHVTVSPKGDRVAFSALGHVYVRDLPDGTPKRLSKDDDVFEFFPTFSPDGRRIAYVTWNDERLGDVRVAPSGGGRAKIVSRRPGHYVRPLFTPRGDALLVERVGAGPLRDPAFGHDQGIWIVPLHGDAAPRLLRRGGRGYHFADDPNRVYYSVEAEGGTKRRFELRSIDLSGADERTHAFGKFVTDYRVSPDGRFLAFAEGYAVHLAPFRPTAKAFEATAKSTSVPVVQVAADAGANLHFGGDGRVLHWSLGPDLYTLPIDDALLRLEASAKTAADVRPPRKTTLGFEVPSKRTTGTVAFVGAKLVTMRQGEVIEDGTVVVTDGRIAAVGPRSKIAIPPGAKVFDATGTSIFPGIVDVHAHGPHGSDGLLPQKSWLDHALLAFGVTTIHDPSNDTATIFTAAEMARAGLVTAPRIFSTGTILYGAETPFMARVESLDDARFHVRRMKAVGAISVKSYNQPRRDQRQMILAAARELRMMVVPEGGSLLTHDMTMVVDGHTGIEHALPVARLYDDVVSLFAATEVGYTPTLVVGYGGLFGENYWYAESDVFAHERLRRFVPREVVDARARRRMLASEGDWNHVDIARGCKKLHDAGVSIQIGAHGQREGLAAHWEIWSLVQGGMTPHEALQAATKNGAAYLGLDGDLGSIEPGKLADLVVVEGDVLADIRASERVRWTVLGGEVYDAATMARLAPTEAPPPTFFFHRYEGTTARSPMGHGHGVGRAGTSGAGGR
ncbi:MAG: amidohydrolase [Deltaproteobacteria bacterium]|nr:MAG: amidohydrolase [Deltaproteobacteria bacterium]